MKAWSIITCVLLCGCSVPAPSVLEIEREYAEQITMLSVLSSNLMIRSFEDAATWDSAPDAAALAHTNLCRVSVFFRWPNGGSRGRDIFSIVSPETLITVSPISTTSHGSSASALMVKCQGSSVWLPFTLYERVVTTNAQGFAFGFSMLLHRNTKPEKSERNKDW